MAVRSTTQLDLEDPFNQGMPPLGPTPVPAPALTPDRTLDFASVAPQANPASASAAPAAPSPSPSGGGVPPTLDTPPVQGLGIAPPTSSEWEIQREPAPPPQPAQAPDSFLRPVNDVLAAPAGELNATQRENPLELSKWQRGILFVADIFAMGEGRMPPSIQLKSDAARRQVLNDQAARKAMADGTKLLTDTATMLDKVPIDQRQAVLEEMLPQFEAMGLGDTAKIMIQNPNSRDAFITWVRDDDDIMGGTVAGVAYQHALARGIDDPEEAMKSLNAFLSGEGYESVVDAEGPGVVRRRAPELIAAGRRQGGTQAEIANRLASGRPVSPDEIAAYNEGLPDNVKLEGTYISSIQRSPEDYILAIPGLKTPELEAARQKKEMEGEYSNLVTIQKVGEFKYLTGPEEGHLIRGTLAKEPDKWIKVGLSRESVTDDPDVSGVMGDPTSTNATRIQKEIMTAKDAQVNIARLWKKFDAELLTYQADALNGYLNKKSKAGMALTPDEQAWKQRRDDLVKNAMADLVAELNRLSGAAISEKEYLRISQTMPDPTTSPVEFENALKARRNRINYYLVRMGVWKDRGATVEKAYELGPSHVEEQIKADSDRLEKAIVAKYPLYTEEQVTAAIAEELGAHYGMSGDEFRGAYNSMYSEE